MKKFLTPLFAILFLYSCGIESMNDMQPDLENSAELLSKKVDTDLLNAQLRIATTGSCEDDCIDPGSEIYYPASDMATLSVGKNTKSVSYSAYNTETDFVVDVTYAITAGPPNAKAAIMINIDGNELVYEDVSSGTTVSHTVPLAESWAGCDEVSFSVVQEGLGTPISFNESYDLIPVCEEVSLEIGNAYQGGIIAYILEDGDPGYVAGETHGIIAAPSDQGTAEWYNGNFTTTGATGTELGTGQANTIAIVNNQGAGNYAASLCNDLVLGGYDDWYLPSKDELNKLYLSKDAIGGFPSGAFYWSSSESVESNVNVWFQNFQNGDQYIINKNVFADVSVRSVRSF